MTQDPPPRSRDLTGTVVAGRYRIVRKLGEGAMGAVYVGEHLRIGRLDAIKVLLAAPNDAETVARFNRGARNLSAIRHPNVCTLYDYGETQDGSPFLALELIDGESLKDLLDREGALTPSRSIAIGRQIAAALEAAHDAGVVHRDLKPANVMLERGRDGSDVAKVVDFDIAKGPEPESAEEVTRLGFVVGTPEYISPEQLMGERLDGRSDIYSLGIVLFRMLTGTLPFRGENTQELMMRRLTERPLTMADVGAGAAGMSGLQAVLDRALARDRHGRYASASELQADLDDLLAGAKPAAAASPPLAVEGPPPASRSIPETIVSPSAEYLSPVPAGDAAEGGGAHGREKSRWRWIAAAALVILGGTTAALLLLDSEPENPVTSGASERDTASGAPGGEMVELRGDSAAAVTGGTDPRGGGVARSSIDSAQVRTTSEPASPGRPAGRGIVVAAAEARETVYRLQDRLDAAPTDTRMAQAARDTAMAIYEVEANPTEVRATAAYVVGRASIVLRDAPGCDVWIDRFAELRPDSRSLPRMRELCRSLRT